MFSQFPILTPLPASDLERARAWYSDILGLEPVEEHPLGLEYETAGSHHFFLYPSDHAGTNEATAISFSVGEHFDEVVDTLRSRGVEFLEFELEHFTFDDGIATMPEGMRGVWFEDSEGNILGISTMSG